MSEYFLAQSSSHPLPLLGKVYEKRADIGKLVKDASEVHAKLVDLLGIDKLNKEIDLTTAEKSMKYELGKELQFFLDVFEAYIEGGPTIADKRKRIGLLAENYQKHPEQIYHFLEHFGLEI